MARGKTERARANDRERRRERKRMARTALRASIKARVRAAKAKPCDDCGLPYPWYVMDLDHREDKRCDLSKAASYLTTSAALERELAKCDVVCANCHRERTHRRGYEGKRPVVESAQHSLFRLTTTVAVA